MPMVRVAFRVLRGHTKTGQDRVTAPCVLTVTSPMVGQNPYPTAFPSVRLISILRVKQVNNLYG